MARFRRNSLILLLLLSPILLWAATRTIAPNATGEGTLGTSAKRWGTIYCDTLDSTSLNVATVYGLLEVHDGAVTNALTPSDTYIQVTGWSTGVYYNISLTPSNMTLMSDGVYQLSQSISFSGGNSKTIESAFFTNGTEIASGEFRRKLGTAGDVGSAASHTIVSLSSNDVIDVRMQCISSTDNVVIEHGQFSINLLGQ